MFMLNKLSILYVFNNYVIFFYNCTCCSFRCFSEYVQLFYGSTLAQTNAISFRGFFRGRICGDATIYTFFVDTNFLTIHYHTDDTNARALQVDYTVEGE